MALIGREMRQVRENASEATASPRTLWTVIWAVRVPSGQNQMEAMQLLALHSLHQFLVIQYKDK